MQTCFASGVASVPETEVMARLFAYVPAVLLLSCRAAAPTPPTTDAPLEQPAETEGPAAGTYADEEVTYQNPASGLTLAGTLSLPSSAGPYPAVLLISGSGAQDRDSTIAGHRPFAVLAETFAQRGIAVLRVEKSALVTSRPVSPISEPGPRSTPNALRSSVTARAA